MLDEQDLRQIRNLIRQQTADLNQYVRIDGGRKYQGKEFNFNQADLNDVRTITIGDGGTTDYAAFAADGELTLEGTARVTREMRLDIAGTGGGANKPTFNDDYPPFDGWAFDHIDDDIHYVFEVPSDCDPSEDIEIHLHWYIDEAYAADSGEINWQIVYRALTEDGTESVDASDADGSSATITSGDINIPATAKALQESSVGTIIAANIDQNDVVGIDLSRIDIVDGNDPTADPVVVAVEVHYTVNKLGEAT